MGPAFTGGSPRPLLSGTIAARRLSRVQSNFGGTTEIMKEIIGRGLGL
jgi:alkylation response protein AidB-like acyl-CoA dehydrogenase